MAIFGENLTAYGGEVSHTGYDFGTGTAPNTDILAAGAGVIKLNMKSWAGFQGGNILIFHGWDASGNPITTHYGHVRNELVQVGEIVKKGQIIATAGGFQPPAGSGVPFQPHLHFSCIKTTGDNAGYWGFFDCLKLPSIAKNWNNIASNSSENIYVSPPESSFQEIEVIKFNVDFIPKDGYEPFLKEPFWEEDFVPKGGYVPYEPSGSKASSTETNKSTATNNHESKMTLVAALIVMLGLTGLLLTRKKR
ncbi:M23 family metallopeptidase [bacterium]|nr:M23 family metallopeptidase [bacterium]